MLRKLVFAAVCLTFFGVLKFSITVVGWLQRRALHQSPLLPTAIAALLTLLLVIQIGLGIANALLSLPLPVAAAHGAAAALLAVLIVINFALSRASVSA